MCTRWIKFVFIFTLGLSVMEGITPQKAHALTTTWAEPYIGWSTFGQANSSVPTGDAKLGTFGGLALGGRAAISFLGLFYAGVDFSYHPSLNFDPTDLGMFDSGTTLTRLGVVGGVNVPIPLLPLRFWVGYNFLDNLNNTTNQDRAGILSGTDVSLSGHSFKAGLSYFLFSVVSLNAEYLASVYNSYSQSSISASIPYGGSNVTTHSLLLSVGVPFTLGMM